MSGVDSYATSEVMLAANKQPPGWVLARVLWTDERVRKTCRTEWGLVETIFHMYLQNQLHVGFPGGELGIWVNGTPPQGSSIVTFSPQV